ncbi:hypothetical protein ACA910_006194 [Epithemia clementina (nom. ined.)]
MRLRLYDDEATAMQSSHDHDVASSHKNRSRDDDYDDTYDDVDVDTKNYMQSYKKQRSFEQDKDELSFQNYGRPDYHQHPSLGEHPHPHHHHEQINPFSSNNNNVAPTSEVDVDEAVRQFSERGRVGDDSGNLVLTGRPPICLYLSPDHDSFTSLQVLIRQNIEFFEAKSEDVHHYHSVLKHYHRQGPQTLQLGQVGVRCCFCASLHAALRPTSAVQYPLTTAQVHDAAQTIVNVHWHPKYQCPMLPKRFRRDLELRRQRQEKEEQQRQQQQQQRKISSSTKTSASTTSYYQEDERWGYGVTRKSETGAGDSMSNSNNSSSSRGRRRSSSSSSSSLTPSSFTKLLWSRRTIALGIYQDKDRGLRFAPTVDAFGFPNDDEDVEEDEDEADDEMSDGTEDHQEQKKSSSKCDLLASSKAVPL